MGIADELVAQGYPIRSMDIWLDDRRFAAIDFSFLDAPYPFVLSLPQAETEATLGRLFEKLGGHVEWQTSLVDLRNNGTGVSVTLNHGGGHSEEARYPWVVACDGAHTAARKLLDMPFRGSTEFILADGKLQRNGHSDAGSTIMTAHGYVMIFPFAKGKLHRVVLSNSTSAPATLDSVHRLLGERGLGNVRMTDPVWLSGARCHSRIVDSYRKGRVFLAGDAAHLHSPVGGQGLNTGVQDPYNLGWKLASVYLGKAPEAVLDSYETERRPVAQQVLRNTEKLTQALTAQNPVTRTLRKWIGPAFTRTEFMRRRIAYTMSGLSRNILLAAWRTMMAQASVATPAPQPPVSVRLMHRSRPSRAAGAGGCLIYSAARPIRCCYFREAHRFANVLVPGSCLLGRAGAGFDVASFGIALGRIGIAAQMTGLAQGALEHAVAYACKREQFGVPICSFQGVSFPIAEAATEWRAARLMTYNVARKAEAGIPYFRLVEEASQAKLFASHVAEHAASVAVETLGGNGYAVGIERRRAQR